MNNIPQVLPNPNFTKLIQLCQKHVNDMASDDYHPDNDDDQYIYEAAIEAVFGKEIWAWINARIDRDDE